MAGRSTQNGCHYLMGSDRMGLICWGRCWYSHSIHRDLYINTPSISGFDLGDYLGSRNTARHPEIQRLEITEDCYLKLLNSAFVLNESRGLVSVDDDRFRRKHRENCLSSTTAAPRCWR
jgi:hypothetical protein